MIAALFIDIVEGLGLLGWAVPALALVTFGVVLPLAVLDRGSERSGSIPRAA
jgi:hypothetical protein